MKKFFPVVATFTLILLADQASKIFLDHFLVYGEPLNIFPGLSFQLIYNQGAAFGILSDQSGWQRWFLVLVSTCISLVLIFWIGKTVNTSKLECFSITFILAGAIGNLLDRLINGYVIDFIYVFYGDYSWPNFNIADSSITIGAALLIYTQVVLNKSDSK
ncbi:MAG: signal peptidase II [Pseudomonadota bacterium]|nr:signal peptidase II [Pseudomonadota bacterium]